MTPPDSRVARASQPGLVGAIPLGVGGQSRDGSMPRLSQIQITNTNISTPTISRSFRTNPEGIPPQSPGLRGTSNLGYPPPESINSEGAPTELWRLAV